MRPWALTSVASSPAADMPDGNLLGIDYGARTVGLAVAHPLTGSARPLAPIVYRQAEGLAHEMRQVLKDWKPALIVLGLPLDGAGNDTEMSRRIRAFAEELAAWAPAARLVFQDERLTSEAAARVFAERRSQGRARRRDAAQLDSLAATMILEAWMTEHGIV